MYGLYLDPRTNTVESCVRSGTIEVTASGEKKYTVVKMCGWIDQTPPTIGLHCICDYLSAHLTDNVDLHLEHNPRVRLHYMPTHASWLNQVELFFLSWSASPLRRGEFASVEDLTERIIAFIKDYNKRAALFRWTYDGRSLKSPKSQ